jgi:Cu+-exporting ATPase
MDRRGERPDDASGSGEVPSERDPVCGMDVEPGDEAGSSDHAGRRYYFCSEACKDEFDADPDAYVGGALPAPAL